MKIEQAWMLEKLNYYYTMYFIFPTFYAYDVYAKGFRFQMFPWNI